MARLYTAHIHNPVRANKVCLDHDSDHVDFNVQQIAQALTRLKAGRSILRTDHVPRIGYLVR